MSVPPFDRKRLEEIAADLDGAAFNSGDNPVIVYTGRYDRTDNFWFTLAHEAAHVLLHLAADREECFLDDLQERGERTPREEEADRKAEKMLKVDAIVAAAGPYKSYLSSPRLKEISRDLGIDVAVILGVLQHKGLVEYRTLNRYKTKVLEKFPPGTVKG